MTIRQNSKCVWSREYSSNWIISHTDFERDPTEAINSDKYCIVNF